MEIMWSLKGAPLAGLGLERLACMSAVLKRRRKALKILKGSTWGDMGNEEYQLEALVKSNRYRKICTCSTWTLDRPRWIECTRILSDPGSRHRTCAESCAESLYRIGQWGERARTISKFEKKVMCDLAILMLWLHQSLTFISALPNMRRAFHGDSPIVVQS